MAMEEPADSEQSVQMILVHSSLRLSSGPMNIVSSWFGDEGEVASCHKKEH